ncbi:MAG: ADP-glyceromanno-heptose 6-epimerase [Bacteriovoracia bacterium]
MNAAAKPMAPPSSILVTGAAGFIGTRLVARLQSLPKPAPLISVDRRAHFATRTEHGGTDYGQIVDRDELEAWLAKEKPALKAVIHLGACTDTTNLDEAYQKRMNLQYSQMLWNHCTRAKTPFIYASSAATYGEGNLGYSDDEGLIPMLKPLNPYGESKRLFDLWAIEQEKAGKTPPSWSGFKFFNVYGFGERHKGKMASVVLHAFDQIQASGRVKLFKSHREGIAHGQQKRDFIYVEDVVDVLLYAMNRPIPRGIYNLGSGQARSFLDLVRATFRAMGRSEQIEFIDTPLELRERYQYFTEAKMFKLESLGYDKPFTPLEEGVAATVARLGAR